VRYHFRQNNKLILTNIELYFNFNLTLINQLSRTLTLTKTIPSFTPFEPRVFYPRLYQLNLGYQDQGDIYPEEMMAHNHILWVRYLVE
jgi:hypothetical protein